MKRTLILVFALLFVPRAALRAADAAFQPVGGSVFDKAAFTQWVDGKETPLSEAEAKGGPSAVVWTATTKPEFRGVKFGDGRAVGLRHLRIGFTDSITVGSVLVRGGGALSVLKADAADPGSVA